MNTYKKQENKLIETVYKFFGMDCKREDGRMSLQEEHDRIRLLEKLSELDLIICGGAITSLFSGQRINDLDFYCRDISKYEETCIFINLYFKEFLGQSINAKTMRREDKYIAQVIKAFHGSPEEIFSTFDFTITTGAYEFKTRKFVFGEHFLEDIAARRLVYLGGSRYPICAMYRTKKFQKRGYELPGSTIMHIAVSIMQLEVETYKELKDQLMGIDTLYLQRLFDIAPFKYLSSKANMTLFMEQVFNSVDGYAIKEEEEVK
jgi:hypothetical protein